MSATATPADVMRIAALRVRARRRRPPARLGALDWARQNAVVVHPTRGRIPFDPYPYQAAFLADESPRRIVLKARQIGFSQAFGLEAAYKATQYPDRTILLVSRNQDLAINLLAYCYNAIAHMTDRIPALVKNNASELAFANGSRIKSLPANRSTGRGFAASDVYLDEYAFQSYARDIYQAVGPTVSQGGTLTVASTPDGRGNHYFQLWQGYEGGEWSRHVVRWDECPVYDADWYARERPKYTAQQWASEYECDFVASGAAVFDPAELARCADGWLGLAPAIAGRGYVTFWDIGRRQDATVGITLDVTDDALQLVAFDRLLGVPYPVIQQTIERRALEYGGLTAVESNGVGDPVIENLRVPVVPFTTTRRSKTDAINALVLAIEAGRFKHDVPDLARELAVYQWDDAQLVQDCVIAAAGAAWFAVQPPAIDAIWTLPEDDYVTIGPRY